MIGGRRRWATPGTRFIAWSAGAVLALMLGGSAVASGDGLSIKVPRSVPTGGEMHQTATGFAAGPRLLVVYITDKKPCASTAKKEEKRHTPRGSVRGERLAVQVNGTFSNVHIDTSRPVRDPGYVCAYLTEKPAGQPGPVTTVGPTTARASAHYHLRRCHHWFGTPFHSACRENA